MSETQGGQSIPAGWYPDPAGSGQQRWWDGVRWTEHLHDAAIVPAVTESAAAVAAPRSQERIKTDTPWIWLIVLLPLVILPFLFLVDWRTYILGSIAIETGTPGPEALNAMAGAFGGLLLITVAGWIISGLSILFSYLDWRELQRRGVERPFHWAWAFLVFVISIGVYIIGRSVIVKKRTGHGLAPLWVWIATVVLTIIVGGFFSVYILNIVIEYVQANPGLTSSFSRSSL